MSNLDLIKGKITQLYETNPQIHVNVSITRPKLKLENIPVIIKGVYPQVFQIEECSTGQPKCHTLQYTDILIKQIEIEELND